jgi:hypothetical protein
MAGIPETESRKETVVHDERITWIRAKPGRKVIQIIEPMPVGFSVTTQWWENEKIKRQDCEVSIREGPPSSRGDAQNI